MSYPGSYNPNSNPNFYNPSFPASQEIPSRNIMPPNPSANMNVNTSTGSFNVPPNQDSFNNAHANLNFLKKIQGNQSNIALFKLLPNSTNSLYVDGLIFIYEGVPIDSNEREVAHIFRPFPGFKTVRLIRKKTLSGREFYFCFVDFENSLQASIALSTVQGYRFHRDDKIGLRISFALEPRDFKGPKPEKNNKSARVRSRR